MPITLPPADHAHDHAHGTVAEQGPDTARSLKILLAAGLILIAGLLLLLRSGQAVRAELVRMDGPVKVYAANGEWKDAEIGDRFKQGARMKTTTGYAVVTVKPGSTFRLATNTEVAFEAVGQKAFRVRLLSGRVYSRVHAGDVDSWQIAADRATVTAEGTAFAVAMHPDAHHLGLDVIEGDVMLAVHNDDASVESTISAGTYVSVNFNKPALESIARASINPVDAHKDTFLGWNISEDAERNEPLGVFMPFAAVIGEFVPPAPPLEKPPAPTRVVAAPKPVVKGVTTPTPKPAPKPPAPKPAPAPSGLALSATRTEFGVNLRWTASSSAGFQGYKVVRSTDDPNLAYPRSGYIAFFTDRNAGSFLDTGAPGFQTVYYRICALEANSAPKCGNVVTIK